MILEIKFDKGEGLNLYINGQSEHLYFGYTTRVRALRSANSRFDKDLLQAASLYPSEKKGAFLWCYTAEFLRSENITDLVKLYYLLELVNELVVNGLADNIHLSYRVPKDAIVELKSLGLQTNKSFGFYKGKIRELVKVAYHASHSLKHNFASFLNRKNPKFKGNLLDVNQSPTNNRLDSIDNFEFYKPYRVFSGQEHNIIGFDKEDVVVFRNENTILDGLIEGYKAVTISFFIRQNSSRLPKVYRSYFRIRDVFRIWSLLLYERGAEKYFRRNRIINMVHVSTYTKPEYRILWAKAQQVKIKVIIVASRTLKKLSSSERLIHADIQGLSRTVLPDYYIVRDEFSKDGFKDLPFYEQIRIGGRFEVKKESFQSNQVVNETVLYLVLTHLKSCSDYFLSEVAQIDYGAWGIKRVIFRCHPSAKYTPDEITHFFPNYDIIDHTGLSMNSLNYQRIIMISGPTTGALELVVKGVSLFWLPYVWKDGILFDDIMNEYGTLCLNSTDLASKIDFIAFQNYDSFEKGGIDKFKSNQLISTQIKSFI